MCLTLDDAHDLVARAAAANMGHFAVRSEASARTSLRGHSMLKAYRGRAGSSGSLSSPGSFSPRGGSVIVSSVASEPTRQHLELEADEV